MNNKVTVEQMLEAVRAGVAAHWPGELCTEVRLQLTRGKVVLPMPPVPLTVPQEARFVPSAFQQDIREALAGKALRTRWRPRSIATTAASSRRAA
jgi:hypothetical protein